MGFLIRFSKEPVVPFKPSLGRVGEVSFQRAAFAVLGAVQGGVATERRTARRPCVRERSA